MPLHALELVLDPASDALVRSEWEALARAGLPSQARQRGATNAPHVTLASAAGISGAAERAARDVLAPLLPRPVEVAGVVLLGRGPYALARLLAPDADLLAAAEAVRRAVGDPHSPGWIAHLTLARRLPVASVGSALAQLATGPAAPWTLVVAGLRRWNPDTGRVHLLAGTDPAADGDVDRGGQDDPVASRTTATDAESTRGGTT